jgi:hypothetical protein
MDVGFGMKNFAIFAVVSLISKAVILDFIPKSLQHTENYLFQRWVPKPKFLSVFKMVFD